MNYEAVKLENCTGNLTIENCVIRNNDGAAIYLYNSNPDITNCDIYGNDCSVTGSALFCYNSSPHLRDNDIHDNLYAGMKAKGGGSPKLTTWNLSDPHRNRFSGNNTVTHTPRADSTWAEVIQMSPTYLLIDYGHNDVINDPGDYLISNFNYGATYTLYASYNYWQTPGTLGSDDFYPDGSVYYDPPDQSPNYIDSYEDEAEAYRMFVSACQEADSERVEEAYRDFMRIVDDYPDTQAALASLRQVLDRGREAGISLTNLQDYFADISLANNGIPAGVYSDRLANLCLVELERFDDAIRNYDAVLEDIDNRLDSLYYAIDRAYAVLQRIQHVEGDQGDAVGGSNEIEITEARRNITRLIAALNGMPDPYCEADTPAEYHLISAFPNPFNSSATIQYSLNSDSRVLLQVYDLTGRLVKTLVQGDVSAGVHSVVWNASDVAGGIYVCRMQAGAYFETVKLSLVK